MGTKARYEFATKRIRSNMEKDDLTLIISDQTMGPKISVFNERTIGRMIVDLKNRIAKVWLLREKEKGWLDYELDFLPG